MNKIDTSLDKKSQASAISIMSSRPLISPFERKSSSNGSSHCAISPSKQLPQTAEKPPNASNGVLRRLLPRRRDSVALPRVMGSLNRRMERVRRHSLVAGGIDHIKPILTAITNTITSPLLTSSEVEPEMSIEENDADDADDEEYYVKDEEAEIGIAIEMPIVPVRARLIYIGCKGLDS
ncbi:hypothetical protein OCU04_010348 [Sclerotinia nivalis]|uniref:Uncharacterized protein n=1 Tax=Sclerotinia nivalis TaxID=352851 RepID=A0A9X0AEH8_9HELO|nr:hypothetical protein OCU04_010348 [Sclerotinia nivalis]